MEEETTQETFGERLRKLREIANLNGSEFGKIMGTSAALISMYESGKRSPNLRFLKTLRKQFHISIDTFIDRLIEAESKGD